MVHLAERTFYQEVAERLAQCDAILLEGISSKHVPRLTRPYRSLAGQRRLGLVLQSEALDLRPLADRELSSRASMTSSGRSSRPSAARVRGGREERSPVDHDLWRATWPADLCAGGL